jgi:predicted RNA-binding Zn-ribbon protein involved in translation (DUF1610 family)
VRILSNLKARWKTVSNLKKIGSKSCNLPIGKCTNCGFTVCDILNHFDLYNYCPNCGAIVYETGLSDANDSENDTNTKNHILMPEPQNGWFGVTSDNEWFVIIRQPNSDKYLMVYENGGYDVGTVSEVFDELEHDFNRYGECTSGNKIIRLIDTVSFECAKHIYENYPIGHKSVMWEKE